MCVCVCVCARARVCVHKYVSASERGCVRRRLVLRYGGDVTCARVWRGRDLCSGMEGRDLCSGMEGRDLCSGMEGT